MDIPPGNEPAEYSSELRVGENMERRYSMFILSPVVVRIRGAKLRFKL